MMLNRVKMVCSGSSAAMVSCILLVEAIALVTEIAATPIEEDSAQLTPRMVVLPQES